MREEQNGASKNKWSRIFKKKWFFPAMYLVIATLLLTVVVWYQSLDNQILDVQDEKETTEDYIPNPHDEDAESVLEQQEVIKMPVTDQDQAEIVTKFYDYNADQEDKENALILFNNRFYQSTGIDIASVEGEEFDVQASLSGTVTEVKEDPILGNVVIMSHENEVMTYYSSLGEVSVKAGSKIKQGETIGTAGKNLFGKDNGTHVHFEIRKDSKEINPESYFNQPVSKLDQAELENDEENLVDEDETEPESELNPESDPESKPESDPEEETEQDIDIDIDNDDAAEEIENS